MYHSGRKRLKTNLGGFIRILSYAVVAIYVYYYLLPELDETEPPPTDAGDGDLDPADPTDGGRNLAGTEYQSKRFQYQKMRLMNKF